MNLIKSLEYFDPLDNFDTVHIIGIGAIGSTVAVNLARTGVPHLVIYDFDTVESKNIANQQYFHTQINKSKTEALVETLKAINPEIVIDVEEEGWKPGTPLFGHVILAVDNIELRKEIVTEIKDKWKMVTTVSDYRMGLTDAQHYMCDNKNYDTLLATMQFTCEEAKEATPLSACGTTLNVITTVNTIVALGFTNLIQYHKQKTYKNVILIDVGAFSIVTL